MIAHVAGYWAWAPTAHRKFRWLRSQRRPWSCGAASLRYGLFALGVAVREKEIRTLARTHRGGTSNEGILRAARKIGLRSTFKVFAASQREEAWEWLSSHLRRGHAAIIDVDNFEHYAAAIATLPDDRIVLVDPAGDRRDERWADVSLYSRRALLKRWRCTDDEDDAFWAIGLAPRGESAQRPPLRITGAAVQRYQHGRREVLNTFLVGAAAVAAHATNSRGRLVPLSVMVRDVAKVVVPEVASFAGADAPLTRELSEAVDDVVTASESLLVPSGATVPVASGVAALLTRHVCSLDR